MVEKNKFEKCEKCPITTKNACLLSFGSVECGNILLNNLLSDNLVESREKEQDYKISSFQIDYSKELFLRVNKLLFDCREVRFSNHFVVSYDCIFRTKHCHVVITLWMHEEQMHCVYYFKHY